MERFRKLGRHPRAHRNGTWAVSPLNLHTDLGTHRFVTGGADGIIRTWSLPESGQTPKESDTHDPQPVDNDSKICSSLLTLEAHALAVVDVAVSADGTVAASTSLDGVLKIWDLTKGVSQEPRTISMDVTEAWGVAMSSKGDILVSCGVAGNVQVIDVKMGVSEQTMCVERKTKDTEHARVEKPMALSVALNYDDTRAVVGAHDGSVTLFDIETGKVLINSLPTHGGPVRSLAYIPSEPTSVVTASDDQLANFYDLDAAQVTGSCRGHSGHVLCVDVAPDGKHIVTGGADRTVRVWDRVTKESLFKYREHEESVWDVAYTMAGKRIVSVSDDESIGIIDSTHAHSVI